MGVEAGDDLADDLPVQLLPGGRKSSEDPEGEPGLLADDRPLEKSAVLTNIFDCQQSGVLLDLLSRGRWLLIPVLLVLGLDSDLLLGAHGHSRSRTRP